MMSFESIRADWLGMAGDAVPQQRLFDSHPLHLYFGVAHSGSPLLLLLTDSEPNLPELSGGPIEMVRAQRADGRHATSIALMDKRYVQAFVGMGIELARATQLAGREPAALNTLAKTLEHWKKMFSASSKQRLSDSEIRGLVAEMHFALTVLVPLRGAMDSVDAWVGPFGAPQDFCFNDRLIEVKSIHPGGEKVWITSAAQLDALSDRPLVLATVEVEDVTLGAGMSLPDCVDALQRLTEGKFFAEALESRWAALGFDPHDDVYADKRFRFGAVRLFAVKDDFPVVRAMHVPPEAEELRYRLSTAKLDRFRIEAPFDTWVPEGTI